MERDAESIARIIAIVAGVPRSRVNSDYVRMVIEADRGLAACSDDVPVAVLDHGDAQLVDSAAQR